jgi:hypothetical protein
MAPVGTPASSLAVPTELTLHAGERVVIPLTGAGSVGYVWRLTVGGDTRAIDARTGPAEPRPSGAQVAGSLPQALFLLGRAPGRCDIQLRLVRVPGQPPRESHDIVVRVEP